MYPPSRGGRPHREGTAALPASGGDGARVRGTVSARELSINVVKDDRPKMLLGLLQRAQGLEDPPSRAPNAAGGKRGPTPRGCVVGTWSARIAPTRESDPRGAPMAV